MAVVALSPGVINTDMLASCFGDSASLYQSPDTWYSMMLYFLHQFGSLCKQKEKHIVPLNFLRLEHKGDVIADGDLKVILTLFIIVLGL